MAADTIGKSNLIEISIVTINTCKINELADVLRMFAMNEIKGLGREWITFLRMKGEM